MFGVNPAMIGFIINGELDKIVNGELPEGIKLKEKSENKIVLLPGEGSLFDGLTINSLNISITHKGVEIVFINE